jgi:hypothetical protein
MTRTSEPLETLSSEIELASGDFKLSKLFTTHAWGPLTAMSTGRAKSAPGDQAADPDGVPTDRKGAQSAAIQDSAARRKVSRTGKPTLRWHPAAP